MGASTVQHLRRITVHVVPADGPVAPGQRLAFGQDPLVLAQELAPSVALRPSEVLTEHTTLRGGEVRMHIDRLIFTPAQAGLQRQEQLLSPDMSDPGAVRLMTPDVVPQGRTLRRFAAYGLVTDPAGRVLLSRIAPGFPGAGTWHLPGGATDHGEPVRDALVREVWEETGQHVDVADVRGVHHHHAAGQIGPEGIDTEVSAVWVLLRAHVAQPTSAHVTETNGSTERSAWFDPAVVPSLPLFTTTSAALALDRSAWE